MEGIHDQQGKSQTSCEDQREQGESPVSNAGECSALLEELLRFSNQEKKKNIRWTNHEDQSHYLDHFV